MKRVPDVYPISSFTWLLIPSQIKDPAKKKSIADFLAWMLTTGQKDCRGSELRAASAGGRRERTEADRNDQIKTRTPNSEHIWPPQPPQCNPERSVTKRRFGGDEVAYLLTLIFASSILLVTVADRLAAVASQFAGQGEIRLFVPDIQTLEPGHESVRRVAVYLRDDRHFLSRAADRGAAGSGRGNLSVGTGAPEALQYADVSGGTAGRGSERHLRSAGDLHAGPADARLHRAGNPEDSGLSAPSSADTFTE